MVSTLGKLGSRVGPSLGGTADGVVLLMGLEAGAAGGRDAWVRLGGAVLIRCDRSRTDEVMGARDAVISSLLGTEFATELAES